MHPPEHSLPFHSTVHLLYQTKTSPKHCAIVCHVLFVLITLSSNSTWACGFSSFLKITSVSWEIFFLIFFRHEKTRKDGLFQAAVELRGTALQPCLELLRSKEEQDRQVPFRQSWWYRSDAGTRVFSKVLLEWVLRSWSGCKICRVLRKNLNNPQNNLETGAKWGWNVNFELQQLGGRSRPRRWCIYVCFGVIGYRYSLPNQNATFQEWQLLESVVGHDSLNEIQGKQPPGMVLVRTVVNGRNYTLSNQLVQESSNYLFFIVKFFIDIMGHPLRKLPCWTTCGIPEVNLCGWKFTLKWSCFPWGIWCLMETNIIQT